MILKHKKTQQIVSSLLILAVIAPSILIFAKPKPAEAQWTDFVNAALTAIGNAYGGGTTTATKTNTVLSLRNVAKQVGQQLLMSIAKKALQDMTKSTVNWINTGYWGSPLFVENPGSFFKDIGKSQIKDFITVTGYDNLKYPFGKQYALNLINTYKQQLRNNAAYSLSQSTTDPVLLSNLRIDFNTGGWNAFLVNTQYPQNNPIGYNLIASQELSMRLDGIMQAPAQKVNKLLEQGSGFLSPQTCVSNPAYNNGSNEFNRPTFQPPVYNEAGEPRMSNYATTEDWKNAQKGYLAKYEQQKADAYSAWKIKNECTDLRATTPGLVVGSQITKTLGTTQTQKELAAALGNSIGAVFDSLLAKFMAPDGGLNSLASKTNSTTDGDNFSYFGQTLDSGDGVSANGTWEDQVVDLGGFFDDLDGPLVPRLNADGSPVYGADGKAITERLPGTGAIALTQKEIDLISATGKLPDGSIDTTKSGILEILDQTWQKGKELDICTPGPNIGWEKRLDDERDRIINGKLVRETSADPDAKNKADSDLKAKAATSAVRDLRFAISSYKDWVTTKMLGALPSSVLYLDAVKGLEENTQQITELTNKKRDKTTTIARLKALRQSLVPFEAIYASGRVLAPAETDTLLTLRRQYNALSSSIGNEISVDDLGAQLALTKSRLENLLALNNKCGLERKAAGWTWTNAPQAYLDTSGSQSILTGNPSAAPAIPSAVGISYIFKQKVPNQFAPGTNTRPGGQNDYKVSLPAQMFTTGTELEQFCELPTLGGFSHGEIIRPDNSNGNFKFTFVNVINELGLKLSKEMDYTGLPMVRAQAIYGDITGKFQPIDVDLDCKTLFKVSDQDYKHAGDIAF